MTDPIPGAVPVVSRADGSDWPQQAAGMIVDGVGKVRSRTTGPVVAASRWVVYGVLAAILGLLMLVLLLVIAIRGLTELLQWVTGEQDIVWLTYALIGIPCIGFGLWLWSNRQPPS